MRASKDRFQEASRRLELRQRIINYKGGCCALCGYSKCLAALEMHHVDDHTKEFNISDRKAWTEALVRELDKCVLLCANCHREVHAGDHPGYMVLDARSYNLDEDPDWD